jgi:hypothetical protein
MVLEIALTQLTTFMWLPSACVVKTSACDEPSVGGDAGTGWHEHGRVLPRPAGADIYL